VVFEMPFIAPTSTIVVLSLLIRHMGAPLRRPMTTISSAWP
jgi:hypothetical protein